MVHPKDGYIYRFIREKFEETLKAGGVTFKRSKTGPLLNQFGKQAGWNIYIRKYLGDGKGAPGTVIPKENVSIYNAGTQCVQDLFDGIRVFENVKPVNLISYLLTMVTKDDDIVLDFFSGSATTAHAVMQYNAENRGNRKFILVQLEEKTDPSGEAYKAGYNTICDIGEERIRRAGKKIREESPLTTQNLDIGFRCFKVDSTNMKDVYYKPSDYSQMTIDDYQNNIKPDRTPEDLLIQVMLDLGILLSSKIEQTEIAGKKVFSVADGYLIACFDRDVTDETVTAIAQRHPFYAVFRDSGMVSDSVAANFEQIFETYSPNTIRKVL